MPISTGRVPRISSSEAGERNTGVDRSSLHQIRITSSHDVGHHSSRRCACDEYFAGVDTVVGDGVCDHRRDALRITSTVVSESLIGVDVEAGATSWRVGVDDDEAIGICQGRVLGAGEVRLAQAS